MYQTISLDKKGNVYCWGKGGLNLDSDLNRHTNKPMEVIITKGSNSVNVKCVSIKANYGNSYAVNF